MSDKERVKSTPETEKKSPTLEQKISDMNVHMASLNDSTFLKALKIISDEVGGDFTKIKDNEFFSNILSEIKKRRAVFDSRLTDPGKEGLNRYIDEVNSRLGLSGEQGLAKFGNPENEVIAAETIVPETIQAQSTAPTVSDASSQSVQPSAIENSIPVDAVSIEEQPISPETPAMNIELLKSDLGVLRSYLTEVESTFLRISIIGKKYEFNNEYQNLHTSTNRLSTDLQLNLTRQLNLVDQILNDENPDIDNVKALIREIESDSIGRFKDRSEQLRSGLVDLLPVIDIPEITDDINSIIAELDYAMNNLEGINNIENQLAGQYL